MHKVLTSLINNMDKMNTPPTFEIKNSDDITDKELDIEEDISNYSDNDAEEDFDAPDAPQDDDDEEVDDDDDEEANSSADESKAPEAPAMTAPTVEAVEEIPEQMDAATTVGTSESHSKPVKAEKKRRKKKPIYDAFA